MQQNAVDKIENSLFELFKASQERKELEKIRDLFIRSNTANKQVDDHTRILER